MRADSFDSLTRRLAQMGKERRDRRRFLRDAGAVTLGTAVLLSSDRGKSFAQDSPTPTSRPPGQPDYEQLLFDLQYDVESIFRHVNDNVRFEPYTGVLRGALGTLWGMAGNSFDQSLLLAALLNQAQVETRLVTGVLAESAAEQMLDSTRLNAETIRSDRQKLIGLPASQVAGSPEAATVSDDEAAAHSDFIERASTLRPLMIERTRAQVTETAELLANSLQNAGIALDMPELVMPDAELNRHMWVQIRQGTDWIDLDPSVPGATAGDVFASDTAVVDAIPEADYHKVTFRVIADVVRGGELVEEELLLESVQAGAITGAPISFIHANPGWIGGTIGNAIAGQVEYRPYIQVGATVFEGLSILFGGQGGALDALGGGGDLEGETIAERLVITISGPNVDDLTETRPVFDRLTADDRASGDIAARLADLPPVELVDRGGNAGKVFLPFVGATNISVVTTTVPLIYFVQDRSIPDVAADLAGLGHSYHFMRDSLAADLADDLGVRFYRDRPAVTMLDIGVAVNDQDEQVFLYSLDLIQPTLRTVALDGAQPAYPPQVVEGVLGQVTERNLLEVGAEVFPEIFGGTFTNVGVVFEAAAAQDIPIQTLSPGDPLPPALAGGISAGGRALLLSQLDNGMLIVIPAEPVDLDSGRTTGWWAINPATGRTIDRMESGRGSTLGEHATLLDVIVHVIHEFYILGMCVLGIEVVVIASVFVISDYGADAALGAATGGAAGAFAFCAAAVA